jgi:hypothetical protein
VVVALASPLVIAQEVPDDQRAPGRSAQDRQTLPASDVLARGKSGSAGRQEPAGGKRVFGVLPNYRTADANAAYRPITVKQKFTIASKDSFDYPLIFLAGAFAGLGQLTDQHSQFEQGMAWYGRRLGTAHADQAIGNMMTEAIFPSLLREDPRYFRRRDGSKWSRTGYALTRVFVTRTASGGARFNTSEWLGNATGVAISNLYYADSRTVSDSTSRLLQQVGTDAISQVLKEFWPDIKRKFFQKGSNQVAEAVSSG